VSEEFSAFVAKFKNMTGIDLGHYNQAQVFRRLSAFRHKHGFSTLQELSNKLQLDEDLLQSCLKRLTINVTEFFRDRAYWDILRSNISDLARERMPLRIWSAGCASGEEAYSLSYMLSSMLPKNCWVLMASDLDANVLAAAKAGLFTEKALKGLEPDQINLMFTRTGELYGVKPRLQERVNFFQHDLLQDIYPSALDVILCRNVIIYFNEKAKKTVLAKLARALNPGGILFLGGSEQIMTPEEFGLTKENVYFYRKK